MCHNLDSVDLRTMQVGGDPGVQAFVLGFQTTDATHIPGQSLYET